MFLLFTLAYCFEVLLWTPCTWEQSNFLLAFEENREHHLQRWGKLPKYVAAWPRMDVGACHRGCCCLLQEAMAPCYDTAPPLPHGPQDCTHFAVCRHKHIPHCQCVSSRRKIKWVHMMGKASGYWKSWCVPWKSKHKAWPSDTSPLY